ncbi:MAG: biotin/lipoyl-binding protein, partial [Planctomycetales bacterium]|nr:biotin/lipoyl-binding protein [Planctomycetales bacterium]
MRAERQEVRQYVEELAQTRLPRIYRVTTPVSGRVEAVQLNVGDRVQAGQVVARMVSGDLQRTLAQAQAAVDRLQASLRENDSDLLEQITLAQAESYVEAMRETVKAAEKSVTSGQEKYTVASRHRERIEELFRRGAVSEEDLDQARLDEIESLVAYDQDRLIQSAMRALLEATQRLP